jgi:hypothetical protein
MYNAMRAFTNSCNTHAAVRENGLAVPSSGLPSTIAWEVLHPERGAVASADRASKFVDKDEEELWSSPEISRHTPSLQPSSCLGAS